MRDLMFDGLSMEYPWILDGFSIDCRWFALLNILRLSFFDYPEILSMDCPSIVQALCPWIIKWQSFDEPSNSRDDPWMIGADGLSVDIYRYLITLR